MEQSEKNCKTKCLAVIRGTNESKVRTAICDLSRFANLTFADKPRRCESIFADNILVRVLKKPLKTRCESAAIVPLADQPGIVIGRFRHVHTPAHVIIVTPMHSIYDDIVKYVDMLPEIDMVLPEVQCDILKLAAETASRG